MGEVLVYWNSHKKLFSVRDKQSGKVFAHLASLTLRDAKFRVWRGGQTTTRETGVKTVHAFVSGNLSEGDVLPDNPGRPVFYNPLRNDTFVFADDGSPALEAARVVLHVQPHPLRAVVLAYQD